MSVRLIPCSACARHVKQGDCACPFCGAKVECASEPPRGATVRLSRAALFAASAVGAALATSDCSSASGVPLYGGSVPVEAGDDSSSAGDYGGGVPPADAGDASPSSEGGSAQPHYGGVVPPIDAGDASPSEGGSVQPLYGAVVPPVDSGNGTG
jgi:hypothetical protein